MHKQFRKVLLASMLAMIILLTGSVESTFVRAASMSFKVAQSPGDEAQEQLSETSLSEAGLNVSGEAEAMPESDGPDSSGAIDLIGSSAHEPSGDSEILESLEKLLPLTPFGYELRAKRQPSSLVSGMLRPRSAGGTGRLNVDHPTSPGEVMLFKEAVPVAGKVNTWDVTLRVEEKEIVRPSDIVLVIDRSGSMDPKYGGGDRIGEAKKAAKSFIERIFSDTAGAGEATRIGIVSFAGDAKLDYPLSNASQKQGLLDAIDSLNAEGGTFTQGGLHIASNMLENAGGNHAKHIVLLSDGEPTFSYELRYTDAHLDWQRVSTVEYRNSWGRYLKAIDDYRYATGIVESSAEYDYNQRTYGGAAMFYCYKYYGDYSQYNKFINHGNNAISEANFAKERAHTIWTIALNAGFQGDEVLSKIASPGNAFTATPQELESIFQNIAGQIATSVREGRVNDPMGKGFEIPSGSVSGISPSQGTASYDPRTKVLDWDMGTLSEKLPGHPNIRYAEITYRIEIDDDILNAEEMGGLYKTNGDAKLTYYDESGHEQVKPFPVPAVDPTLYVVSKTLYDYKGDQIAPANRTFHFVVTGSGNYRREFSLKAGEARVLTDLREGGVYSVAEVNDPNRVYDKTVWLYQEGHFDHRYDPEEQAPMPFVVRYGDPDMAIRLINRERSIDIQARKIWDGGPAEDHVPAKLALYADGVEVRTMDQAVITPSGKQAFDYVWRGLPMFSFDGEGRPDQISYTVQETEVPEHYQAAYNPAHLTVTNTYIPPVTSISVQKTWVGPRPRNHLVDAALEFRLSGSTDEADWRVYQTQTLADDRGKWTEVPLTDRDGRAYEFRVRELNLPAGYTAGYSVAEQGGSPHFIITNTFNPAVPTGLIDVSSVALLIVTAGGFLLGAMMWHRLRSKGGTDDR